MRVWFNHWFSTVYHLINLMRDGNPGAFTFIGTSTNPLAIYKNSCDAFYVEPADIGREEYIEYCLQFCQAQGIDVFVPRRYLVDIVKSSRRFRDIGVKLFANADADTVCMLDDKQSAYEYFRQRGLDLIPPTRVAHNLEEFKAAVEELEGVSKRVCYKLVRDEGARTFRVIDDGIETLAGLYEKPSSKVTRSMAFNILKGYDFATPILVMPYLSGVEISVDCLKTEKGTIIIPRYKTNSRYSEVIFGKEIMEQCERISDALPFEMPFNIQFKQDRGQLYLLEVNPRMSGGLQLSCKATGINIPSIAVNQLLGRPVDWKYPDRNAQKVAHIETPICLE